MKIRNPFRKQPKPAPTTVEDVLEEHARIARLRAAAIGPAARAETGEMVVWPVIPGSGRRWSGWRGMQYAVRAGAVRYRDLPTGVHRDLAAQDALDAIRALPAARVPFPKPPGW